MRSVQGALALRNVSKRHVFFHNGFFKSLKDTLTFYVQRDTNPEKWYPLEPRQHGQQVRRPAGAVPEATSTRPKAPYNRQPGDAPALSDSEIDDVISFLNTLSGRLHALTSQ